MDEVHGFDRLFDRIKVSPPDKESTSCGLRTAARSTRATQAATALPPATAYGIFAARNAAVARNTRSRTASTASIILCQENGFSSEGMRAATIRFRAY